MRGTWKGKQIDYTPGRVMVGLRNGASLEKATQLIEQSGAKVDYISKSVIDVVVDSRRTLEIASALDSAGEFRFVTPQLIERGSSY